MKKSPILYYTLEPKIDEIKLGDYLFFQHARYYDSQSAKGQ